MITAVLTLLLGLVIIGLIIAANGYFVAQEFAYMSVDRNELRTRADNGDDKAKAALKVTNRTSFMLSGAQLGITVTGLLVGFIAEPLVGESLGVLLGGVFGAGFDVPVLRLLGNDAEDLDAGPGVSVPAVDDFMADPQVELVGERADDLEELVLGDGGVEVDVVRNKDGDEEILEIGFRYQDSPARVDVPLQEKVVALVPLPARQALEAEKGFALQVEMLELVEMHRAVLARPGIVRVAYHARRMAPAP